MWLRTFRYTDSLRAKFQYVFNALQAIHYSAGTYYMLAMFDFDKTIM